MQIFVHTICIDASLITVEAKLVAQVFVFFIETISLTHAENTPGPTNDVIALHNIIYGYCVSNVDVLVV